MDKKISLYQDVELQSSIATASPHRLVQLLYEAALSHLQLAQHLLSLAESGLADLDRSQMVAVDRALAKTVCILEELRDSSDMTIKSKLPHNLDLLYDYILSRLLHARLKKDPKVVGECFSLLETLKSAWDAIDRPSFS